jgi:acetolactate synthase-1/2/3 large subunit
MLDKTKPKQGARDLVSHQLVRYLEGRGITHIFGLCGHTNIALLSAMANSKVHFVSVRHEQIAAHAADAYARVTGKASVLLTHLGPGLTNGATGVANAALDCTPMVVIAGDIQVIITASILTRRSIFTVTRRSTKTTNRS